MMMEMIRCRGGMVPVPFHDDTIFLVEHEENPYVPVKPIVENLGLAWQVQHRKLTSAGDRWGVTIMVIPSEGGRQKTLCLPLSRVFGYLMSIEPNKVKAAIRPKLIEYQQHCDEVLQRYWTGQMHRPTAEMEKLIEDKVSEAVDISVRAFWRQINEEYRIAKRGAPKVSSADACWWRQMVLQGYTTARIAELAKRAPSTIRRHTVKERAALREQSDRQTSFFQ